MSAPTGNTKQTMCIKLHVQVMDLDAHYQRVPKVHVHMKIKIHGAVQYV